jgi:hypothetical protein
MLLVLLQSGQLDQLDRDNVTQEFIDRINMEHTTIGKAIGKLESLIAFVDKDTLRRSGIRAKLNSTGCYFNTVQEMAEAKFLTRQETEAKIDAINL